MVMTVFASISEFEQELVCERIAAMTRGVKFGRPQKLSGVFLAIRSAW